MCQYVDWSSGLPKGQTSISQQQTTCNPIHSLILKSQFYRRSSHGDRSIVPKTGPVMLSFSRVRLASLPRFRLLSFSRCPNSSNISPCELQSRHGIRPLSHSSTYPSTGFPSFFLPPFCCAASCFRKSSGTLLIWLLVSICLRSYLYISLACATTTIPARIVERGIHTRHQRPHSPKR